MFAPLSTGRKNGAGAFREQMSLPESRPLLYLTPKFFTLR
jgi:hypothetical protein